MSQLNPSKKGDLLFILIIILIIGSSVGITYLLIISHVPKIIDTPLVTEEEVKPFLVFKGVEEKEVVDALKEYPVNPIKVSFDKKVKITGLKDKEIQNKINERLSVLDTTKKYNYNGCRVNFNVSNVLSVTCKNVSKNIDLTTGRELGIEDIFNKNSDIQSMLVQGFYNSLFEFSEYYLPDTDEAEAVHVIENLITSSLREMKKNNFDYYISYLSLVVDVDSNEYEPASINFGDNYRDITIYERFLTDKDIYEEEVTDYCRPTNCYTKTNIEVNNEDNYYDNKLLNDKNYFNITVMNDTKYDITYNELEYKELDMDEISKIISNEIIDKYDLKSTSNYKTIDAMVNIFNNGKSNQASYEITINELNEEEFMKSMLGSYSVKEIRSQEIKGGNMLIDVNNVITYLNDNPKEIFENFEDRLRRYILVQMDNNPDFNDFSDYYKCAYTNAYGECVGGIDYSKLIDGAIYAVDEDNNRIYMKYQDDYNYGNYVNTFLPLNEFK